MLDSYMEAQFLRAGQPFGTWSDECVPKTRVPQQNNTWDCGVYVLCMIERMLVFPQPSHLTVRCAGEVQHLRLTHSACRTGLRRPEDVDGGGDACKAGAHDAYDVRCVPVQGCQ